MVKIIKELIEFAIMVLVLFPGLILSSYITTYFPKLSLIIAVLICSVIIFYMIKSYIKMTAEIRWRQYENRRNQRNDKESEDNSDD